MFLLVSLVFISLKCTDFSLQFHLNPGKQQQAEIFHKYSAPMTVQYYAIELGVLNRLCAHRSVDVNFQDLFFTPLCDDVSTIL